MRQSELSWKRLKHVTAIKGGAGFPHEEQGLQAEELPFFKVASLEGADSEGGLTAPDHRISRETAKRLGAHVFPPGTVVFAKVGAALLLNRFRQLIAEACLDNNMMGLEPFPEQVLPRFLMYSMSTKDLGLIANPGAVPSVNGSQIAEEKIWCPSLNEQERIANFLDYKTARIDALIAEKEQLVERLSEYRKSVATTAITQGVPGTHSEFTDHSFLGSIPLKWRAGKFRHYVQIRSGQVDPEDGQYSSMTLIAPNHIESGSGRLLNTETAIEQAAESGKYWCDAGDVIYSKIRPALRKVTIAPFDCLCSADMYPLKGRLGLSNEFLFWYLLSEPFSVFAVQESVRVAMPKLNRETLADAVIPLPSSSEQLAIVSYIRERVALVDSVLEHAIEHIARLREYRSSLISAAVTGQFDFGTFRGAM